MQDSKSDERFHVELHFSPGVYSVGQNKEYLAGRGYRPQHGEKKQVLADRHTLGDFATAQPSQMIELSERGGVVEW